MDLTVHIGAHRTGSTLVAQAITASVEADPACGVAVWHPRYLRSIGGWQAVPRSVTATGAPASRAAGRVLATLSDRLAEDAAALDAQGVRHLVISEENLVGTMRTNMTQSAFYPDVASRLRAYASVLPMVPARVALGVRDYGAVWSSAFHYIPQSGNEAPSRQAARTALLDHDRGWPDVIESIYDVWPDTEVYVWQQEDLEDHAAMICAGLLDLPHDKVMVPSQRVNRLKSSTDRSPLFTPDERALLTQRYHRHLSSLHATMAAQSHQVAQ